MLELLSGLNSYFHEFNFITVVLRLVLSVVIGAVIGNERGRHGSAAGLRAHILVCIGSAMTALTGMFLNDYLGFDGDVSRISAQVISGIGFLGAGMIIVRSSNVITGLTTAAGMWATAAIGIALGYGFYAGAVFGALACFFTAAVLTKVERRRKRSVHIYVEISEPSKSGFVAEEIRKISNGDMMLEISKLKSGKSDHLGFYVIIAKRDDGSDIRERIEHIDGVYFAVTE